MKKITLAIIFTLLGILNPRHTVAEQPYIRRIEITRQNVFDKDLENRNNLVFRIANKLHRVTRERIIRQEVLLEPGQKFDQSAFEQSIRNIRALAFIGDVNIQIDTVTADSIDIELTTEDLWTTIVGLSSESGGGKYKISLYGDEKNIAGLGIGIETTLQYASDKDNGISIQAYDSRFLGSRNMADLNFGWSKFSRILDLTITRPFYTSITRWSFALVGQFERYRQRLFNQGNEYFRYKRNLDHVELKGIRAFGVYRRFEPYVQYIYQHDYYGVELAENPYNSIIPANKTFSGPGLGADMTTVAYDTAFYLDQFGAVEDLTYRYMVDINGAWSGKFWGGDRGGLIFGLKAMIFQNPIPNVYAGIISTYSSYQRNSKRVKTINEAEAVVYFKLSRRHILAANLFSSYAWRNEDDYQITLGGRNGLRGYPDRYYSGIKTALFNGEYRFFTPLQIFTVALGGAAFFDAGYAWAANQPMRLKDFKKDIGLGLRLGLTKSSTARVVRIDLARGLDRKVTYLSMGTSNVFDLDTFK